MEFSGYEVKRSSQDDCPFSAVRFTGLSPRTVAGDFQSPAARWPAAFAVTSSPAPCRPPENGILRLRGEEVVSRRLPFLCSPFHRTFSPHRSRRFRISGGALASGVRGDVQPRAVPPAGEWNSPATR